MRKSKKSLNSADFQRLFDILRAKENPPVSFTQFGKRYENIVYGSQIS